MITRKMMFAHRGLHNDQYPENSLGAFQNAVDNRYAIELDVHLMKDNSLAVFHDDTLMRMTEKRGLIELLTKDELPEYKLKKTIYSIPTLKSVLNVVKGVVPLLIELKVYRNAKKIAKALVNELKGYEGEVMVQSFDPFALRFMYKFAPEYKRGQLSSYFRNDDISSVKKAAIKKMIFNKFAHIDFVSYNVMDAPNKFTDKTKKPLLLWTIKSQEQYDSVKDKCDGIVFENFLP